MFLPSDFHEQAAMIGVLDDGEGMDAEGLKRHWLIGVSNKGDLSKLPQGRQQIGKVRHRQTGDVRPRFPFHTLQQRRVASSTPHPWITGGSTSGLKRVLNRRLRIKIALREPTEHEAAQELKIWIGLHHRVQSDWYQVVRKARPCFWTLAILSDLKEKVHEIRRGTLEWVLRTALPLRDDFSIYLDGNRLEPSKAGKGASNVG